MDIGDGYEKVHLENEQQNTALNTKVESLMAECERLKREAEQQMTVNKELQEQLESSKQECWKLRTDCEHCI